MTFRISKLYRSPSHTRPPRVKRRTEKNDKLSEQVYRIDIDQFYFIL